MLKNIDIEGYRGFKKYSVANLSHVNLLVGKNNVGKTSLLEAIDLLTNPQIQVFEEIAFQRSEPLISGKNQEPGRITTLLSSATEMVDLSHFFYGHDFGLDKQFCIQAKNNLHELEQLLVTVRELPKSSPVESRSVYYALMLDFSQGAVSRADIFNVTEEGGLLQYRNILPPIRKIPVQFITTRSLRTNFLGNLWDNVVMEGKEQEAINAMKILAPELTGIYFLVGDRSTRSALGNIFLGFSTSKKRIPLGSYGEGMQRLLALSLALIRSADGILLIDEIDTGLHWSVLGDMWRLVVETAKTLNIQVFATTHSLDCLKGLAWLCENYPDLEQEVTVQKIEPALDEAVCLTADQIQLAVAQGIEVR